MARPQPPTNVRGKKGSKPPTAPSGLVASVPIALQVNLSWNASSDETYVSRYRIYRWTDASPTPARVGDTASTSYQDAPLVAGTLYYYTVSACNAAGAESAQSNQASATVIAIPQVTGLTATAVSSSQINLAWFAVTGASGYVIRRDGAVVVASHPTTTYSDTGRTAGQTYTYTVAAIVNGSTGAQSSPVSATTQAASTSVMYFSDSWETGSNSLWSTFSSGYTAMPVVTTYPIAGTYCCSRTMTNGQASLFGLYKEYGTSGNLSSQIRNFVAQFSVAFDTFTGNWPASQQKFAIFQYFDSVGQYNAITSNGNRRYQIIPCLNGSGQFSIYLVQWSPANAGAFVQEAWISSTSTPTRGSWDTLRVAVQLDTNGDGTLGVGHGNGTLQVWLNNTLIINQTNVNFVNGDATQGMGRIFVTSEGSNWQGTNTTMYWDRLEVGSDTSVLTSMPSAPVARVSINPGTRGTLPWIETMDTNATMAISGGGTGSSQTYHANGGWNNQGYIEFQLPTILDGYSCIYGMDISNPGPLSLAWLMYFGPDFINACGATGTNPKTVICLPDPGRAMVLSHSYAANGWEYIICNNIDAEYTEHPQGGFNLHNYLGQWLYFEAIFNYAGNHELWVTTQSSTLTGGTPQLATGEKLIKRQTSLTPNPTQVQVLGSYGGARPSATTTGYFRIGRIWLTNASTLTNGRRGPPPGFRTV